jgi:hypothetical protein
MAAFVFLSDSSPLFWLLRDVVGTSNVLQYPNPSASDQGNYVWLHRMGRIAKIGQFG